MLFNHADPTIEGWWTLLYAAMAFAAIKLFGQFGAEWFGPRLREDVFERRNWAAAQFIAAYFFHRADFWRGHVGRDEPRVAGLRLDVSSAPRL